jgi:phospholipase/carboxylesterase
MHTKQYITAGKPLQIDSKVLIMLHGRGANAEDILSLANYLPVNDYTLIAPQATNYTWYPYSFMAPAFQNEPWLGSAIELIHSVVEDVESKGISATNIFFLGFSQGACLTLEYVTRNARQYGGVIAFTGGLIGEKIESGKYTGDFHQTPVFIGTSDPDPHVPVKRVMETEDVLKNMNANMLVKIYKNMGHTISQQEIESAIAHIFPK